MLRAYWDKVVVVAVLCLLLVMVFGLVWTGLAVASDIRKFCAPQSSTSHWLQLFLVSNIGSQQAALQRNKTLQQGEMFFSTSEGDALFHTTRIEPDDCVLVNLQEAMRLAPKDVSSASDPVGSQARIKKRTFVPAVFLAHKSKAKHFGLIDKKVIGQLRPTKRKKDITTAALLSAPGDPDLVLIYILCPPDRNSLCDLTIKQNNRWLRDKKTGKQFHLPVLARSLRNGRPSSRTRRIQINHDTPQGIYTIWGTMTGGGDSPWLRTARIDLDAALPPMNAQPYPVNSFLLSRIIPDEAQDDYWVNEWPLAYSLGRVFLRIASGDFEAQLSPSLQSGFGRSLFHPTHGCINTGEQQQQLLRLLVEAGVFRREDLIIPSGEAGKRWSVSPSLGKAFVILKDSDGIDSTGTRQRK